MAFKLPFCHSALLHFIAKEQLKNHRLSQRYENQGHKMKNYLFSVSDISPSTFSNSIENVYKNCDDSFSVALPEPDFLHLFMKIGLN